MPGDRLPVELALLENLESRFHHPSTSLSRAVSNRGAHGHGVALALAGAFEETDDVLASPVGVVALPDDHSSGFDSGLVYA